MLKQTLALIGLILSFSANAYTIETISFWNGTQAVSPFGEDNTATYGQTFSLSSAASLDSFTFLIDDYIDSDFVDFQAYIMAWGDSSATGSVLFQSVPYSTSNNSGSGGFESFAIDTGGISLSAGNYVAFFSASNLFDGQGGTSEMAVTEDVYSDGTWVFLNNGSNFSALTQDTWRQVPLYDGI